MRVASVASALFAATFVGLGVEGIVTHDFGAIWQPVPKAWPVREALVWVCALVSIVAGGGLLWRGAAAPAAGLLTAYLAGWMLVLKAPAIAAHPAQAVTWESCGETAVLAAAAWSLFASLAGSWQAARVVVGPWGLRLARWLYGAALIAFGVAHLAYVKNTASLVPAWLPAHTAWVYVTGAAYIAAGVAIIAGVVARVAAVLAAVQIGLFTLLVWVPAIATAGASADDWSEAVISWALTAAAWVIAGSYSPSTRPGPSTPRA